MVTYNGKSMTIEVLRTLCCIYSYEDGPSWETENLKNSDNGCDTEIDSPTRNHTARTGGIDKQAGRD